MRGHAYNFIDLTKQRFGRLFVLEFAYKKGRVLYWKCKCDCGTIKDIRGDSLRNGRTKSCGCLMKELVSKLHTGRKDMFGKNNPNWRGGRAPERNCMEATTKYKQWRIMIYDRDDYTCQRCGKRGRGNINAHHIYLWSLFYSLRYEDWNGITLCETCHRWVHSKQNTNQDYLETK